MNSSAKTLLIVAPKNGPVLSYRLCDYLKDPSTELIWTESPIIGISTIGLRHVDYAVVGENNSNFDHTGPLIECLEKHQIPYMVVPSGNGSDSLILRSISGLLNAPVTVGSLLSSIDAISKTRTF